MLRLDELEAAINSPIAEDNLYKAEALAMYIARSAPNGPVANLAMQVMSAAIDLRSGNPSQVNGNLKDVLSQLRSALKGQMN
jgi:hypothetical protein